MRRKTEQDYLDLASRKGFKWLGPFPKTAHCKTWWKCRERHDWEATYSNIYAGTGCPVCNLISKRKIKEDYCGLAKSCGFKWVDTRLPKNVHIKTLWECKKGHTWLAKYNDIYNGSGCPYCSGNIKKIEKDYYDLAESKGFKWVGGELPDNVKVKTLWECKKGHRWLSCYGNINGGYGCPYCSGKASKTEKDYYELAKLKGFKWVGENLPKTTKVKTWWECKNGHRWLARYNNIYSGYGCPYCKNYINGVPTSKPQIKLNDLLCGSLNYPEGKYRIDVAIMRNSQKIAVEYDCRYWHQGKEDYDAERDKFLIYCGWKMLHVKSSELLPTRKQLKKAINKLLNNKIFIINIYLDDWENKGDK